MASSMFEFSSGVTSGEREDAHVLLDSVDTPKGDKLKAVKLDAADGLDLGLVVAPPQPVAAVEAPVQEPYSIQLTSEQLPSVEDLIPCLEVDDMGTFDFDTPRSSACIHHITVHTQHTRAFFHLLMLVQSNQLILSSILSIQFQFNSLSFMDTIRLQKAKQSK
ncbi:hypothetical protein CAPTEDRAFT_212375 [Capitella teleta]|uniref:Uncharacterized protein n=1 Tax=Capitella teleta TaxID=283909 RepID=R7UXQ6_CAPTE|nr:hypothetical protein CAPTEDRAFT_212375 [Capitella teleta]|eukprot:ELU08712.1 hypothetical protein CAPTEDRAFT_212375 [Capitella teleta]